MDGDEHETQGVSATTKGGRACDACRARKIRCDRSSPCSNCRICKVACRFSPKVNEHRQRILISSRYERQVESIDERLLGIENCLQALMVEAKKRAPQSGEGDSHTTAFKTVQKIALQPLPVDPPRPNIDDNFEGDTSLLAHSLHAKGLFEKLSSRFPSLQSTRLKETLASLHSTLKSQSEPTTFYDLRFTSKRQAVEPRLSELEMPPMQAVLDLLRSSNEKLPQMFLEMPLIQKSDFTEKCRTLYFCTTGYSPALFAIVNAGLYYLFSEQSRTMEDYEVAESQRHASICQFNFELTLENLHLLIAPSLEACQALIIGAFYAAEFDNPSLCLRLTANAAQMTQSLGYHRLPATEVETRQLRAKKLVFWGIYSLDKALSLQLGRTSIIQDCDISTTITEYPENPLLHPWHEISLCWIEFAKFQGRVFAELFTVASLSAPQITRENKAQKLATELQEWRQRNMTIQTCDTLYPEAFQMALDSIDIVYFGVLTIIYRATPPSPAGSSYIFNPGCIVSARKALELHQAAASRYKVSDDIWKSYVYWTLLYSPFAPFMVVFCEAIATLNFVDLHNLREFVSSIKPTSGASRATVRLYNLCSAFYKVAQVYFEESSPSTLATGSDITTNVFLVSENSQRLSERSNIHVAQNCPPASDSTNFTHTPDKNGFMTWPTEDWFLPDQYMMGILDSGFGRD